ncbi:MAG: hypothetical protein A2493_00820 [Candidatus Magasanikbacteria bacterium RIFOXYC12_FULL_33_11]|uniref:Prepilin-type N-terminal cleavage/methylation domain-containing protein n=1 Tax=Candidatus Magasanikbacteria bacterium RIFOXYC12_FULL_33_11 TaxID=1798701 RepID=A0A1F6NQJ2_9BACT|nr:MAG: hypothetical protein A2493_00820 [Candidatus Magasanikbacteria bacterium RIFOXYC12_FULL_33_11]
MFKESINSCFRKNSMLNKKGFTIIETLIYVAIVALVSTGLMKFSISITNTRNKVYVVQEVHANMRDALTFIEKKIQEANGINTGSSTFDTDPGVLSLSMASSTLNPTIISLSSDDGILQITEGTSDPIYITTGEVRVSDLQFSDISLGSISKTISFSLTIDYNSGTYSSQDFKFTQSESGIASIRN